MKPMAWLPLLALALAGCIRGRVAVPADPPNDPPESNRILAQFSCDSGFAGWRVENGATPADRPQPLLMIAETGNAVFAGDGPASILCDVPALDVSAYRTIRLGLKGDGQRYQLRLDAAPGDRHSYAADFQTSGDWQEIVLPFADFTAPGPAAAPYPGQTLACVRIRAPAAPFRLEIDRIWLEK